MHNTTTALEKPWWEQCGRQFRHAKADRETNNPRPMVIAAKANSICEGTKGRSVCEEKDAQRGPSHPLEARAIKQKKRASTLVLRDEHKYRNIRHGA